MTPRDTFNTFVSPAAADCQSDPGAPHRAVSALCHIDALAKEVWHATKRPEGSVRRYRNSLQEKCVELGYAWDVHDIHKHGLLTRTSTLPNNERPQVVRIGQAFQSNVFQNDVFQMGRTDVVLRLRDGTAVRALDVIQKCVQWWDAELLRLGWPR
jgi:hypothetical protein